MHVMQPSWTAEDAYAAGTAFVASLSKAMVFMRSLRGVRFLQRTDGDSGPLLVLEVADLHWLTLHGIISRSLR